MIDTDAVFEKTTIDRDFPTERNDCTVTAIAEAFEVDYERAWTFLAKHGRKPKQGYALGVLLFRPEVFEKEFNVKLTKLDFKWSNGKRRHPSIKKLVTEELASGNYLVRISGHAFAIKNKKVVDRYLPSLHCRAVSVHRVVRK